MEGFAMWKIQLFKLNFDEREAQAAYDTVASGWLTMGERTTAFESAFGTMLGGGTHCISVANCTAALHMALLALDVGPGDEVIIPALTFVANANTVAMVGATPVLADCDSLDDWNVSAATIEAKLTPRTKAVMVVHYAGYPCDMPAISKLCRERGVRLIEDVAHAPGAAIAGRSCGTWGDIGCFSFFSNKNLSIGEGGMVSTSSEELLQRLRHLRSHGMNSLTLDRHKGRAISYDVITPGLNYRMDEVRSAIGLVQLEKLAAANERRGELTAAYRRRLAGSNVAIPFSSSSVGSHSVYHILPSLLPVHADRKAVIEALKSKGIQSSIHYPAFWGFTAFQSQFSPADAPIVADICERELTLPLYPTMSDDDVDAVCDALSEAVR
jgi:dTDP-4-amino-4,6-dideoxygalactose transaminase